MIDPTPPADPFAVSADDRTFEAVLFAFGFVGYSFEEDNARGKYVHGGRHPDGFVARLIEWHGLLYSIEVQAPDGNRSLEDRIAAGLKRRYRRNFKVKGIAGIYYRGEYRRNDDLSKAPSGPRLTRRRPSESNQAEPSSN